MDQSAEGYENFDILWSHKSVNINSLDGNLVEMPFLHAFHKLKIKIKSEKCSLPEDLKVSVNGTKDAVFVLSSGSMRPDNPANLNWITPRVDKDELGVYHSVIVPQSLSDLQKGAGWIRIFANGKEFYYKTPYEIGGYDNLHSEKETVLNLTLKGNGGGEPVPGDDLSNRKAMAFVINDKSGGRHDINIWGAEFDEEGYASYIYIMSYNNPFGDPDPGDAACFRKEISYRNDLQWRPEQTYMGNSVITALGLVDLRQDLWRKHFPDVILNE